LLPKSSILGRGLTTAGAISIQNTSNTLPVKLISFTANCIGNSTIFKWETASETNNSYFTIEASTNQNSWATIVKVSGSGNSNAVNSYSFTATENSALNKYYRLKQTDFDGHFTYSDVVAINQCGEEAISVELYPNPATGIISLSSDQDKNQKGSVSVYDILGVKVFHTEGFPKAIDLTTKPNGIYFLHFTNGTQTIVKKL
jgi:hypothetical protein